MQFEWDDAKNRLNIEKHQLSFETPNVSSMIPCIAVCFRIPLMARSDGKRSE